VDIQKQRELLTYIYKHYDVEKWTVNGIQIWPRVRVNLFVNLSVERTNVNKQKKCKKNFIATKLHLYGIVYRLRSVYEAGIILLANDRKKIPQEEDVAIVGYHHLRNFCLPSGQYYNVYMDPIVDLCKINNWKVKYFERKIFNGKGFRTPEYSPSILLSIPIMFFREKAKFYRIIKKKRQVDISREYYVFCEDMIKRGINPKYLYSEKEIIEYYYFVQFTKDYFSNAINRQTCKMGLCVDSASDVMEAFVLACRECNIPTVEIQHGVICDDHCAFANFKCSDGYNTLPDYFFCWDNESAEIMSKWTDKSRMHNVKISGNLWHLLWKEDKFPYKDMYMEKMKGILNNYGDYKDSKCFLISLQGDNISFPKFLYDVIAKEDRCFFIVRLHPTTSVNETRRIERKCEQFKHVFFDNGSDIPVMMWYFFIDANITMNSTIIKECAWWGIPSISVDVEESAYEMYKIEKEHGLLYVAHNGEELIGLVKSIHKDYPIKLTSVKEYTNCISSVMRDKMR